MVLSAWLLLHADQVRARLEAFEQQMLRRELARSALLARWRCWAAVEARVTHELAEWSAES